MRHDCGIVSKDAWIVSIHSPLAGWDSNNCVWHTNKNCFNSLTPCGVRLEMVWSCLVPVEFQFTHPLRGETNTCSIYFSFKLFQFTHPLRGETHVLRGSHLHKVSIHSPLAGWDVSKKGVWFRYRLVSIHSPLAGWDNLSRSISHPTISFNSLTPCGVRLHQGKQATLQLLFQFTHPLRGETRVFKCISTISCGFNSLTPCGVRQFCYL